MPSLLIATAFLWIGWKGDGRRVMSPLTGLALLAVVTALTWLFAWWTVYEYMLMTPTPLLVVLFCAALVISPFDPRLAAGTVVFVGLTALWGILTWSMNIELAHEYEWDLATPLVVGAMTIAGLVIASRRGNQRVKNL